MFAYNGAYYTSISPQMQQMAAYRAPTGAAATAVSPPQVATSLSGQPTYDVSGSATSASPTVYCGCSWCWWNILNSYGYGYYARSAPMATAAANYGGLTYVYNSYGTPLYYYPSAAPVVTTMPPSPPSHSPTREPPVLATITECREDDPIDVVN